ncbi:MAG: hypothetical protein CW338_11530 [Clostridiales bacterium]|nr:hypothetical protein [Clostridiales bacterium]
MNGGLKGQGKLRILHHENAMTCNTFEDPYAVVPVEKEITVAEDTQIALPPACVAVLTVKTEE